MVTSDCYPSTGLVDKVLSWAGGPVWVMYPDSPQHSSSGPIANDRAVSGVQFHFHCWKPRIFMHAIKMCHKSQRRTVWKVTSGYFWKQDQRETGMEWRYCFSHLWNECLILTSPILMYIIIKIIWLISDTEMLLSFKWNSKISESSSHSSLWLL